MRFYQELTIIKTPEISPYFVWSKLYSRMHLALVEQQNPDKTVSIGVSFPEYKYVDNEKTKISTLGNKLRIFSKSKEELEKLNLVNKLQNLSDYIHIKSIRDVPENLNGYLLVSRYTANTNLERITRRYAKRKGIDFDQAKVEQNQRYAALNKISIKEAEKHYLNPVVYDYPYVKVTSYSSSSDFSLLIKQTQVSVIQNGTFSTYGLSSTSTVPNW